MKNFFLATVLLLGTVSLYAQKSYTLLSPDKRLTVTIDAGKQIYYAVAYDNAEILAPSQIALQLADGRTFGKDSRIRKAETKSVDTSIQAPFYLRSSVKDHYNELAIRFKEGFAVVFRAYDEGLAYRFVADCPKDFTVENEIAEFRFGSDCNVYAPYVKREGGFEKQYFNSFENTYTYSKLSALNPHQLIFAPVVAEVGKCKVCITEADLEHYPGMYLINSDKSTTLKGHFAPCPKTIEQGGHNKLQGVVRAREAYIAQCSAHTAFPWRTIIVTDNDARLADNDMVFKLASPARITDFSWVKPGKVAWEWWNDWGLKNVDFRAGVNDATYKAYIDFAADHGMEYVILDEGWAVNLQADLFQVVPEIDLEELCAYAKEKQVGLILWAGYYAFDRDMERICEHYAKMGIKGFKIDFMDRDDQPMVDFHYRAAETAARHKLMVDFHGTYKPTGLNRTYPNVVNFEGVHGLEQLKWGKEDQVTYDVTMPFIRMVAGPIDYTQGAMRNASRSNYRPVNSEPMSQGTRCRQLAEYIIFFSPLSMLCDSPTNYAAEKECTAFISTVPTVWDETIALNGKIGKYITTARRSGDVWYVGSLTDWKARTIDLDLKMLGEGDYQADLFCDGMNADKIGSDYIHKQIDVPADRKMQINAAPGGGFVMKITKK